MENIFFLKGSGELGVFPVSLWNTYVMDGSDADVFRKELKGGS